METHTLNTIQYNTIYYTEREHCYQRNPRHSVSVHRFQFIQMWKTRTAYRKRLRTQIFITLSNMTFFGSSDAYKSSSWMLSEPARRIWKERIIKYIKIHFCLFNVAQETDWYIRSCHSLNKWLLGDFCNRDSSKQSTFVDLTSNLTFLAVIFKFKPHYYIC